MTLSTAPALIGIAHGSRNPDAAAVTESLVSAAGARLGIEAHAAYLENFASPSITEVAKMLAGHGYSSAVAVPLLFTEAYHATEDAPSELREAKAAHGIELVQAEVLGTGAEMVDVLATRLDQGEGDHPRGEIVLLAGANEAVQALGDDLSACTGRSVHVRFATCEPRINDRLEKAKGPGTVLPLFAAPGLLLDRARERAQDAGWLVLDHLGDALAPIVAARYEDALSRLNAREA